MHVVLPWAQQQMNMKEKLFYYKVPHSIVTTLPASCLQLCPFNHNSKSVLVPGVADPDIKLYWWW